MTRIVHCKKEPFDKYIGRPGPFGNPFTVKEYGRKLAFILFRKYFYQNPELQEKVRNELKDKILGCWCKPKTCHGDVYVEYLNALDNNKWM